MSQCINYIREQGLFSIADLEARVSAQRAKLDESTERCAGLESRLKEVTELLRQAQNYVDTKPIYDEWYSIRFIGYGKAVIDGNKLTIATRNSVYTFHLKD